MSKHKLIIIHSFPTNSIILRHVYDFLGKYFDIYPIDLPGFTKDTPPLTNITIRNFAAYVEKKIEEFNFDSYIIGGISFGFLVITNTKLGKECKGILAIEPFTGYKSLNKSGFWRFKYLLLIKIVSLFGLTSLIWKSKAFKKIFRKYLFTGQPEKITDTILEQIDGQTFVETFRLILGGVLSCEFHKSIPHAIIINKEDTAVKGRYLERIFENNIERLLIINTDIQHFPRDLSEKYFIKHMPKNSIAEAVNFLRQDYVEEPAKRVIHRRKIVVPEESEIKIVTQNCFFSKTVKQVTDLVDKTEADVYCLQEITGDIVARRIKEETGYGFIISEPVRALLKMKFHNVIITNLEVVKSGERNFLAENANAFAGKIFWAVLKKENKLVKVYNCYLSVRSIGMGERTRILKDILDEANSFDDPVVVCGDMNTVIPDRINFRSLVKLWHGFPNPTIEEVGEYVNKNEKYIFHDTAKKCGFTELTNIDKNTWVVPFTKKELFNLKLDWFLTKGFEDTSYMFGECIGDHKSIIGHLKI